ncbi:hypothetical protein AB0M57_04420 [Streptomyces sp. NPDC051597]|uniref:hypothetical protein n=1 Tax=Streptomyces sp. NPDC051597 TaxID=3155049 RepID=UPI003447C864
MSDDYVPEVDDIKAMRAENNGRDLSAFLRQQIRDGNARRATPPKTVTPKPPGHKPGGWPSGTRPPDPPPAEWSPEWDAALADYRTYIAATEHRDRLVEDKGQVCECQPCTDLRRMS